MITINEDRNGATVYLTSYPNRQPTIGSIKAEMTDFDRAMRKKIEDGLRAFICKGGKREVATKCDTYTGYPTVYSTDYRCIAVELKGACVKNDRVYFRGGDMDNRLQKRRPHCEIFSLSELLQFWSVLQNEAK